MKFSTYTKEASNLTHARFQIFSDNHPENLCIGTHAASISPLDFPEIRQSWQYRFHLCQTLQRELWFPAM